MRSRAALTDHHLEIVVHGWARFLALAPRVLRFPRQRIASWEDMAAREAGRMLGWRIGGTALSRQRAMGWFTVRHHKGARAWVWLTPGRTVRVFRLDNGRVRVVAVPVDWLGD